MQITFAVYNVPNPRRTFCLRPLSFLRGFLSSTVWFLRKPSVLRVFLEYWSLTFLFDCNAPPRIKKKKISTRFECVFWKFTLCWPFIFHELIERPTFNKTPMQTLRFHSRSVYDSRTQEFSNDAPLKYQIDDFVIPQAFTRYSASSAPRVEFYVSTLKKKYFLNELFMNATRLIVNYL